MGPDPHDLPTPTASTVAAAPGLSPSRQRRGQLGGPVPAVSMPQTSVAKRANFAGAAIILRVFSMMQRMFASAMRSGRLPSCGVPK